MEDEMRNVELEGLENCESEEDLYRLLSEEMLPQGEELSEEDLELVAGGMSKTKAVKIVTKAYWDLCVKGKKSTSYSTSEIQEALDICSGMGKKINEMIKRLGGPIKKLRV